MLFNFLMSNRSEVIKRCREKVAKRIAPSEIPTAVDHGVPLFLQQLIDTLRAEQTTAVRKVAAAVPTPAPSEIGRAAALHGTELLHQGYSIDQVVHDYGDVCQTVTELAVEQNTPISADEFRTLNRCLDDAIADAVTSFGRTRQIAINDQRETLNKRLNSFAEEQRRLIDMAIQSFAAIKLGNVGPNGATGKVLMESLLEVRSLPERTLPEVRPASATTAIGRAEDQPFDNTIRMLQGA